MALSKNLENGLFSDEIEKLVTDDVSPINSENKFFFLDFYGLDRFYDCLMNNFAHEKLKDTNPVSFDVSEVFNKEPALYKTSLDEHGHITEIHEIPPCIFIDKNEDLKNLMKTADGSYKLPSSISYLQYQAYCQTKSVLMTNIIYLIPKLTKETSIQTTIDNQTVTLENANNGYYEYIITSIEWNNSTGRYDINWEMLGGREGGEGGSSNVTFSNIVLVETLSEGSDATASVEVLSQTEESTIYQLKLGIPKGKSGDSVKLRVENNVLQYKMESDTTWTNLYELENLRGIGISNIEKTESSTESSGKNTIQITMSDGQTFNFDVYNGAKGEKGNDGFSPQIAISTYKCSYEISSAGGIATFVGSIPRPLGKMIIVPRVIKSANSCSFNIKYRYQTGVVTEEFNTTELKVNEGFLIDSLPSFSDIVEIREKSNLLVSGDIIVFFGKSFPLDATTGKDYYLCVRTNNENENVFDYVSNNLKGVNGTNGQDGSDGVSITNASLSETGHLILEFSNGNSIDVGLIKGQDGTNGIDGQNGQDGSDGIGISKIEFTSSTKGNQAGLAGATDTYTITCTDNSTTTFIVYNGKNGTDGSITIDDAMSDTSTNTVQNMVIKKYVDDIVGNIQTVLATLTTLSEGGN